MDIALSSYRNMERLGELGPDDIRFKARMFMHLSYMVNHRVLHASAIARTVFASATDAFVVRLPAYKDGKRSLYKKTETSTRATTTKYTPAAKKPTSGCYLCTATDHYSSDTKFHPLLADGTREKLTPQMKKAILERIDKSDISAAMKASEKENVRQYWSRLSL